MSDKSGFKYQSLKEHGDFRILELEPTHEPGREIQCRLTHCNISNPPLFQALSYTWGLPDDVHPILINNSTIFIRKNLYLALLSLRRKDACRTLWVDAVCTYSDRYRTKYLRNLRFKPLFCEGFGFAHF
jgi:Heterokaryon incompatibility protein (HET)